MLTIISLHFQTFQPDDSNLKVLGNGDDLLVDDTTESITSVLRKEIEGKIAISNPKVSNSRVEGKDSLGESFVDAKEELLSTTSLETHHKESLHISPTNMYKQTMGIDGSLSNRKRKNTKTLMVIVAILS